jgi:two-component system phosphate regulon sensor histidine kinase PhoR
VNPKNFFNFLSKSPRVVEESLTKIKSALKKENDSYQKEFLEALPYVWLELNAKGELLSFHSLASDFLKIPLHNLVYRKIHAQIRDWEPRQYFESFSEQKSQVDLGLVGDRHWRFYKVPRKNLTGHESFFVFLEERSEWIRLSKHRKDFVANVSHELKTPLTIMKGSVDTLLDMEDLSVDERKHFLGLIGRNTEHLMKSVDALLLLARLDDGQRSIPKSTRSVKEILEEVVGWYLPLAESKNVSLKFVEPLEDLQFDMATSLMQKALANLIENAIKHNPPQTLVEVEMLKSIDHQLILAVKDNGVGVPELFQKRIFERFFRLKNEKVNAVEGSGLGLALVKHITELHGGKCSLMSSVDQGSEFLLSFPLPIQEKQLDAID